MMLPSRNSIALRLAAAVLAVEFVASLAAILLSLGYEHHTHFQSFDVMLRGRADSVLGAVQDADDLNDNIMLNRADLTLPASDIWEVYDEQNRLLGRSANWPTGEELRSPLDFTPDQLAATPEKTFSSFRLNGHHYRLLLRHGSRIVDPGEPGGGHVHHVTILYGAPTGHVWGAIRGAVEFYTVGSLLLLLVTGPLIAWLLHRGLFPLRQLAALSTRISVDEWQFNAPESARTTPELAPLTLALESALERLHRSFDQQRGLVSDSAHELKTAVAVAKSSLQLLNLAPRTQGEYRAGLDRTLTDIERLERLVARMLTLARIESASASSACCPAPGLDFAAVVRSVVCELSSVAALRQVEVCVKVPANSSFPVVLSAEDAALLVSNLLVNALEHSAAGSAVHLRLARIEAPEATWGPGGAWVEFRIEDQGEGIDPEALPHLFERFYRGDPSRARSTGGAGLGLAICKAVVTRANGTIEMASERGKGTTVVVRLGEAAAAA
jgi:signal transduction histidine kinase